MAEKKKVSTLQIIFCTIGGIAVLAIFGIIGGKSESTATTQEKTASTITINREEIWNDYKTGNIKSPEAYGLKFGGEWIAIIREGKEKEDQEILIRYAELLETVGKDEAYKAIEEEFAFDNLEINLDLDLILAEEEQRIREERREMVEEQFSFWDGAHIGLAAFIKENMNNPKSYEHVKTLFRDDGDYITVQTTFRGTNSFNAIVPTTITAKCSIDGHVLEIVSQK